jgi:hypothetical protein
MDDKQNHSLVVPLTDAELARITNCANAARMSPNDWARSVVADIARRVERMNNPEIEK